MKVHEQRDQLANGLAEVSEWHQDMRVYLQSAKFTGEGNDYISTKEMLRHLQGLADKLFEIEQATC